MQLYMITGFLGAGKTTALRNIINSFCAQKVAVIINEFGVEGVDAALLDAPDIGLEQVNGGSVFCSCRLDQFEEALRRVMATAPEIILVEASGLSDPSNIRTILSLEGLEDVDYRGGICIVDAENFQKVLSTVRVCKKQLAVSSLVLVNKADLVDEDRLAQVVALVREHAPGARVETTCFGRVQPQWLQGASAAAGEGQLMQTRQLGLQKRFVAFGGITLAQLTKFIDMIAEDTHRIKGFVRCAEGMYRVDCVGARVDIIAHTGPIGGSPRLGINILAGQNLPMQKSLARAVEWYSAQVESVES